MAVAVAASAWLLARTVDVIPAAPLALIAAVLLATNSQVHAAVSDGAGLVGGRLLRLGVMLLGAQLSLAIVVEQGAGSMAFVLFALAYGFGTTWIVGHVIGLSPTVRVLIGAGIGICGNSAIAAIAPLVRADRMQVALAVAVVTISGTIAVIVYPLVGAAAGMEPSTYGLWAGIAIADTGQVMAAGLAGGPDAASTAVVTKLTRNAFLGPVALVVALAWVRQGTGAAAGRVPMVAAIPPFVVGFVALAALRSTGLIDADLGGLLATVGASLILVGLAGIGLGIQLSTFSSVHWRIIVIGIAITAGLSAMTLALAWVTT